MTTVQTPTLAPLTVRPSQSRGHVDHGWLKSAHSFSFGSYYAPENTHYESLRVINDDFIAGGGGFPMHPHKNFEIFSYIVEGALEHRDSMGNGSVVSAGGIQYMSAGSGVEHSEFNPSKTEAMRLLQIWLIPNEKDAAPKYDQLYPKPEEKDGKLKLILSHDGRDGSLHVRSDTDVYAAYLKQGQSIDFAVKEGRRAFVQIVGGTLSLNGTELSQGDAAQIDNSGDLEFRNGENAEFILFEFI
ncbi:pirin family protein [Rhodobacteraceae bacterium RKSG542]|uniref:pirin family protein n=1 Tax=Pseudovibrio flavus TaxID=2529854 RepID=UPI0012BD7F7F|nr:pirin family protein [Pseudovibrio flavus]MTI19097.1 pirin family protein [Pseudovibrio flavus]